MKITSIKKKPLKNIYFNLHQNCQTHCETLYCKGLWYSGALFG